MSHRSYALVTGVVFLVVAILHLLRVIFVWEADIGGWVVPIWLSWVALAVAGYLAYEGFRPRKR